MNALALYLIKSVTWLAGFAMVFFLFLKNERFFRLNRFFLLTGILASFFLPFLTIHYYINFPGDGKLISGEAEIAGIKTLSDGNGVNLGLLLSALYISGAFLVTLMIILRSRSVFRSIKKSEIINSDPVKLVRTNDFACSFSFFSYVFVNPSVSDVETKEIVNHELSHIRQLHWVDLVLTELLCVLQWFNPVSWIYTRFIRQNHEYLADAEALQRSSDPAIYRATLLNQIVGSPVFSLVNSFNYSLNKKRFKMMKNIIISPYRKIRMLLILPVMAVILYAFAKPEYRLPAGKSVLAVQQQSKEVKGTVVQQNGTGLSGANIVLQGMTIGTITDAKGSFKLENVPGDARLVVSYIGYKSKVVKPVFNADMVIKMMRDTINADRNLMPPPPPPPPPPAGNSTGSADQVDTQVPPPPPPPPLFANGKQPLIVIDGKVTSADLAKVDPESIGSMSVLKDEIAISKYGDKGKNGVIEVTLKKGNSTGSQMKYSDQKVTKSSRDEDVYTVVEEMPSFIGGNEALTNYMVANFKYPAEAVKQGIMGEVTVTFVIGNTGKISDVKVEQPVNPLLDAEAIRLISSMPDWKPGSQNGKPVDVIMKLPVNFKLK